MKRVPAVLLVAALLTTSNAAFAQEPVEITLAPASADVRQPERTHSLSPKLMGVGIVAMITGAALFVASYAEMGDEHYVLGSTYCVTSDYDVYSGGCGGPLLPQLKTYGLVTMGAGLVLTLVGAHQVKIHNHEVGIAPTSKGYGATVTLKFKAGR